MTRGALIRTLIGLAVVLLLGLGGCWRSQYIANPARWGETMGTTYSLKISGKVKRGDLKALSKQIESELLSVNRQMSTWDPESEISKFNHSDSTDAILVSDGFVRVVERALELSRSTDGAFDPTLQPLLSLWGFGSEAKQHKIPTDAEINAAKELIGWQKVVLGPLSLRKTEPGVTLALGAIAKGYGVDAIAQILDDCGYDNWYVEIGGEVRVMGMNPEGVPWKIGIQYPSTKPFDDRLQGILHISRGAVATSGDYRNYIESEGVLYTHILDPHSGHAMHSNVASVSVYASNCMDADGIATALFVLGPEKGLEWVEVHSGIEAMFLLRMPDGQIIEKNSSGFVNATGYTATHSIQPLPRD